VAKEPDGGATPPDRLRAGNEDRELVAERLRAALDEGRITLDEYDNRVANAYQALTYADLNALLADIPTRGGVLEIRPMRDAEATHAAPAPKKARKTYPARDPHRMPTALYVLWTIWSSIVALNVVIWLIVCVTTGNFIYPWPLWVAGPTGAALLGTTVGVRRIRERRRHDELGR
jgi:hypothetical protein